MTDIHALIALVTAADRAGAGALEWRAIAHDLADALESLAQDKDRLDWLAKKRALAIYDPSWTARLEGWHVLGPVHHSLGGTSSVELRAAIDAAMGAQP